VKASEKLLLIMAIISVAFVAVSQAVIASLYHGMYSRADTIAGAGGFLLFCGCLVLALGACDFFRNFLLKLFACAFFVSNFYTIIRAHISGKPMPLWGFAAAGLAFIVLFWVLFTRVGPHGWKNISKFIIGSACVFALSPLVISLVLRSDAGQSGETEVARFPKTNNLLVLILDETSPEYAKGMIRGLTDAQLFIKSTEVAAAGKSTINSIPSMFSTSRHDDVTSCNSTALCGPRNFDFASLTANRDTTDIVGFWHPYCAIKGLRSCVREEGIFAESSSVNFGLYVLWCGQFDRRGMFAFCEKGIPHAAVVEHTRKVMSQKIHAAPFWQEGGRLFVHFPLPHPSMTYDFASLKVEYEHNVGQAEQLVSELTARMMSRFGKDFTLVITSDHALRTMMWCASPQYSRPGCVEGLPPDRGRVPYIIASPKPIDVAISVSNVGLLSPSLFR
jgi:hypothetical protein